MHPLNHKERQDKFFYFVVLFTLTIVVTVVAFYSTNSMVTDAIVRNNAAKTSQFFNYRQSQQDYVNQLTRLNQALSSRAVIDHAIGIIMAESKCPAEQAFGALRRASNNRRMKLRDLAAEIVTRVGGQVPAEYAPGA